jgi:hypothetical protein
MARDFIKIDVNAAGAIHSVKLKNFVNILRAAQDQGHLILDIMSHANDGTVFTDIETLFGLPTGQGQIVFNLVNGTLGSMTGTFQVADATTITSKVG